MDTFYVRLEIMQNHAKELLSMKSRPLGRKKKILSVETLYVPGYVFTLNVKEKNLVQAVDVFIDAVTGDFAFIRNVKYEKKELCGLWEDTARISKEEAEIIARENFARQLLRSNLKFRKKNEIQSVDRKENIFYPYWIGVYSRKNSLDFNAIDGVTGKPQGGKIRITLMQLLLSEKNKDR